jgi:hypothetical protein
MPQKFHVLDVVALTIDLPGDRLVRGQVGTIVERLADDVYQVEFSDDQGRTYACLALTPAELMALYHQPVSAADSSRG